MRSTKPIKHSPTRITSAVLVSSLCVGFVLTALLLVFDCVNIGYLRTRTLVAFCLLLYLGVALYLSNKGKVRTANWMIIAFYSGLAFCTLLWWGLNAAIGVFATSFIIVLAGVLHGSRVILPVSLGLFVMLGIIQTLHTFNIFTPDLTSIQGKSSYFDVISYSTILGIFALITWLYNKQIETSLKRAKAAEATVRAQKDSLAQELATESAKLRQTQQDEMQQLYKFATLGQSVAATLHELSNYLSVLTMDMDDLKQQHKNSNVIKNAEESILQINTMVRKVRRKLNNYDQITSFNVSPLIRQSIKDVAERMHLQTVEILFVPGKFSKVKISGDPFAFSQIITILITNAVEACMDFSNPKVTLSLNVKAGQLHISVVDTGLGIPPHLKAKLFSPATSSKPSGLGVGLYIARRLAESHFKGNVKLNDNPKETGAEFIVSIPVAITKAKGSL
jgi:signal transduction histidine kinase